MYSGGTPMRSAQPTIQPTIQVPTAEQYMQMLQAQAMARAIQMQGMQQYEQSLPQYMQYSNADAIANNAGAAYARDTIKPETAKAATATGAGGVGGGSNSFQAAKQAALRAALERNKMSVMDNARSAAIRDINSMRSGYQGAPYNGGANYSSAFGLQDTARASGYGGNMYGSTQPSTNDYIASGITGLSDILSNLKSSLPNGQIPAPHMGGIPGAIGRVASGVGNAVLSLF